MDRAEVGGFGVALVGHAAIFAALSVGLAQAVKPPVFNQPIEVALVDEVGLESTAPAPSYEMPAPKLAEVEGPVEEAPAPEPEPAPVPQPQPKETAPAPAAKPAPKVVPKRAPKPAPKAAPAKPAKPAQPAAAKAAPSAKKEGTRSAGRLAGLLNGISDAPSKAKAITPPAARAGPAVEASLIAEVRRQIRPHWQRAVPTGADAEKLRTQVNIKLARDGRVTSIEIIETTGKTASNRPQVSLHQERARRAITLASPFRLPAEHYESWKDLTVGLDQRLTL